MQAANKQYKFHNVIVADTRLLAPMDIVGGSKQPEVLVLNSKIYNCQPQQTNCASCCLHIEQPEFRRRSLSPDYYDTECFADCSKRRSVYVELNTKAQLSGKLVILALSRIDNLLDDALSPASSSGQFKCKTESTWPFLRFDPFKGVPMNGESEKLAHYSSFNSKQVPSLLIDSMDFSWNRTINKESISLTIKSNLNNNLNDRTSPINKHRRRSKQQIVINETLLINEMDCFKVQLNDSDNRLTAGRLAQTAIAPSKVHLLTIINRQQTITNEIPDNRDQTQAKKSMQIKAPSADQMPLKKPESSDDKHPGGGVASNLIGRVTSIEPTTKANYNTDHAMGVFNSNYKLAPSPPTIDSRLNGEPVRANDSSGLLPMNVPFLNKKYELNTNDTFGRMAPAYLNENDLIRARLRSSNFLVLTVSSGLVILTYTLCLLAYLRWRHKVRARSRDPASDGTTSKSNDSVVPIQRVGFDISQPYNLQMPSATRTRLKMMLRGGLMGGTGQPGATFPAATYERDAAPSESRLVEQRRQSRLLMKSNGTRAQADSAKSATRTKVSQTNETGGGSEYSSRYKTQRGQLNFGSINVVRAIRQAATLARSRLNLHSRYRPNLNVIPESDLECLQSPAIRTDTYRGLFDQNPNLVNISAPRSSRPEAAQFDSLVEDAMRTDCSHYVDKLTSQRQSNATLFSKPIDESNANPADAVSRSMILRYVKQGDKSSMPPEGVDCIK